MFTDYDNVIAYEKDMKFVTYVAGGLTTNIDPTTGEEYELKYNRNENYVEQLSDWAERVAHFHVKGTVHAGERKVDDPPAGMDDLNWSAMFAILYSRKYTGDLSIEPHSATWHGELGNAGVIFTRDFIRKYMV